MEDAIRKNIDQPRELERLYQSNRRAFRKAFDTVYQEYPESSAVSHWKERLHFKGTSISWGTKRDAVFVLIAAVVTILIDQLPDIFGWDQLKFFQRNHSFVYFPALIAYFAWKQKLSWKVIVPIATILLLAVVHINLLPDTEKSDTSVLAFIHLPVFLWMILGFVFAGKDFRDPEQRMDFLRYNGDLVVFSTILALGLSVLSLLTIGLFSLIGFNIEEYYVRHIMMSGMAVVPLTSTYFVRFNPNLVDKVSPLIAKVFAPLVFLMLAVFLGAMGFAPKDLYSEHEFLLVFNILLFVVTALVFFSIAETAESSGSKFMPTILFLLTIVTIIIAGLALSAVLYRTWKEGVTPNRLAVAGTDILLLTNLASVAVRLLSAIRGRNTLHSSGKIIASFLPAYAVWAAVVTFVFPFLFNYR